MRSTTTVTKVIDTIKSGLSRSGKVVKEIQVLYTHIQSTQRITQPLHFFIIDTINLKYPLIYHEDSLKEYRQLDRYLAYVNNENDERNISCNSSKYVLYF